MRPDRYTPPEWHQETRNESRVLVHKEAGYFASEERKALAGIPTSHIAKGENSSTGWLVQFKPQFSIQFADKFILLGHSPVVAHHLIHFFDAG